MPQTARHTTPQSPAWGLGCRYWKKQHLKPFWKSPPGSFLVMSST
jgi:hypothetical protein